jgi:hypothetical protein
MQKRTLPVQGLGRRRFSTTGSHVGVIGVESSVFCFPIRVISISFGKRSRTTWVQIKTILKNEYPE